MNACVVCSATQVRVENIPEPSDHIAAVLDRVKREYLCKTYQLTDWCDASDFLEKLALKAGRLLKVRNSEVQFVASH